MGEGRVEGEYDGYKVGRATVPAGFGFLCTPKKAGTVAGPTHSG